MISKLLKNFVLIIMLMCTVQVLKADDFNSQIKLHEDSLNYYFAQLGSERNDLNKEQINEKILQHFRAALNFDESFEYSFPKLKHIGVVYSDDELVRIITWNLPYNDRTHKYFGFVQYKKSKRKVVSYELHDESDFIKKPDTEILSNENWYGALYYQIIVNKYKGDTYYTLLGADLNDLLSKKKIIEIMSFERHDRIVFGKKVFRNKLGSFTRMIFEYNAQANMVLTYDKQKEMIIFDHLSPSKPSLKGQFEFYGPDFSYDGLKFERGIWNSYPDIDVRNYNIE